MESEVAKAFVENGYRIEIHYDSDPPNPWKDYDKLGTVWSWDRERSFGDATYNRHDDTSEIAKRLHRLHRNNAIVLYLESRYDGELCMAAKPPTMAALALYPEDALDGTDGVIFLTKKDLYKNYGSGNEAQDRITAEQVLRAEVEEYNYYATGECYGYVIEDAGGEKIDSCWGFLGDLECCEQEARTIAQGLPVLATEDEAEAELADAAGY